MLLFQSTHPRGVRLHLMVESPTIAYFNPRTHVGCDTPFIVVPKVKLISIHAPTWGATARERHSLRACRISIHAPTWGATCAASPCRMTPRYFNPRTHVGCDGIIRAVEEGDEDISIHAPTWGATYHNTKSYDTLQFQSTHPRGVRHDFRMNIPLHRQFQSTHPRGVRRGGIGCLIYIYNFNPRTHVGCDDTRIGIYLHQEISIHAPTWGATDHRGLLVGLIKFQSTHPRGVRPDDGDIFAWWE